MQPSRRARSTARPFVSAGFGESFAGMHCQGLDGTPPHRTSRVAAALLRAGSDFRRALTRIYDTSLESFRDLLVVESLRTSSRFMADAEHRREAIRRLVRATARGDTFVVLHPPHTVWRAADHAARFRLPPPHHRDLSLCVQLGTIGFAQLCDDRLRHAVPLLVLPVGPDGHLHAPRNPPTKVFSQRLRVERVGPRRLILFDTRTCPP